MKRGVVLVFAVALVTGCASPSPPAPSDASGTLPIPAKRRVVLPSGVIEGHGGIGMASVLHASPSDPRIAWLEGFPEGSRTDVIWPEGFRARFVPNLEVLDPDGRVVLREGDFVDGGWMTGDPSGLFLAPPFLAFKLECGPMPVPRCSDTGRLRQIARGNGWPEKDIASVRFVSFEGRYLLVFEDGRNVTGLSSVS